MSRPRPEVVDYLFNQALEAMDDESIVDLTPAEVVSASFTLTSHIVKALLANTTGMDLENNVEEIRTAIAKIYTLVAPAADKLN